MEVSSNNHLQSTSLILPQQQPQQQQQTQQPQQQQTNSCSITSLSRSNSPASSNSEIEKEFQDLDLNSSGIASNKSNGTSSGGSTTNSIINSTAGVKKRISSSRTPTRKARRIKFYRNGDRFYPGITIPVSNERYRSFESLAEDLTRLLEDNVKIPGAVRTIYTLSGKKISNLDEFEDGQSYVCSCNNEHFKKIEYSSQQIVNNIQNKANNRLSKIYRPSSPLKNGTNGSPILKASERDMVVHPRIVTLIRNGTKPRKIMRLLLNKRNSPSFDHVLIAITQKVRLDTGCVRKVFTVTGTPVLQLADFFAHDYVFLAYGTERVSQDDFKLEAEENKVISQNAKTLRNGTACKGPKPKMPVKSKNMYITTYECVEETLNDSGIAAQDLPAEIRERYALGNVIGDGNFAIVLKIKDRQTSKPYALKVIDKSKCKGKKHYIDAEVRVMKKLNHPHIISLIMDVDQPSIMYLVLEYVSGGDLFDAITRVTRFSEEQSRVMIKHLAAAMAYLHSMSIVHRDIKPENLLVELDDKGHVVELKLADFGLACEVTEPLFAVCGTPTYVAPEILMETGYGLKIDVWAAGIILYILLCGFPPFVSPDNQQEPLFDAIISGVYEFPEPYWSDIGDGVRDLIANMLQSDPDVRFTSEDILDHYWTLGENFDYR
ncbi:serine/threonine-protein kinase GL21140 isoform X2 [Episyrphus balteatus]|nr:serine/threonine-protein kinase GL21140 isoform X2 [Episyrphus balteatus]